MGKRAALLLLCACASLALAQKAPKSPPTQLKQPKLSAGMVITSSTKFSKDDRVTLPPGPPIDCVTITGEDIVVDFGGSYIKAQRDVWRNRENFNGTGLLIKNATNVVVKNANVQGFRFNVRIVGSKNVRLENCDTSFSRTARMMTNGVPTNTAFNPREPEVWRSYGAGVWIEESHQVSLDNLFCTGCQNGVVVLGSAGTSVSGSDLSFNSGWGIAVAGSQGTAISQCRLDFINRYAAGRWDGGAASVLLGQGAANTTIFQSSLTHSGTAVLDLSGNQENYAAGIDTFASQPGALLPSPSTLPAKAVAFASHSARRLPQGLEWLTPTDYGAKDWRGELAASRQAGPDMVELFLLQDGITVSGPDWVDFADTPEDPRLVRLVANPGMLKPGEARELSVTLRGKDGKATQTVTGRIAAKPG